MSILAYEKMVVSLTEMKTEKEIGTLDVGWKKEEEITSSDVDMLK